MTSITLLKFRTLTWKESLKDSSVELTSRKDWQFKNRIVLLYVVQVRHTHTTGPSVQSVCAAKQR